MQQSTGTDQSPTIGTPTTIFDLGYFWQEAKDSSAAFLMDSHNKYFLLQGTKPPLPATEESWLSTVVTDQASGYYYAPNNGKDNKIALYKGSQDKYELEINSEITAIAYSPKSNSLYVGTQNGLQKVQLDLYTGKPTSVQNLPGIPPQEIKQGRINTVFANGLDSEVLYIGTDSGLYVYRETTGQWTTE